ncbi:MAG: TetR/AcrR family transcriptional regulator [Planctomycetes bacterium]|nr:TetR/AcrR family transcriptional regulator [Planctomycetota bacterium]
MRGVAARLDKPKLGRPVDPELGTRRREEILDAAARLFARHGYSETDTQLLADQLQVGKGTIYRYFRSKRELFLAAVDRVMRKLREQIDAGMVGSDDALERIERAVHAYLRFFADNPDFVELLIQERAQFRDRKKPTYFEHRDRNVERWRDMYRELIAQGRVRDMPVERITNVFSQALYGTIFINYFTGEHKPHEQQARDILDVVFHGILTEKEARRSRPGRTNHA